MKTLSLVMFILVICGFKQFSLNQPSGRYNSQQPGGSLEGRWNFMPVLPSDTASGKLPFLVFDLRSKRVTGNTGCNNFSGTFALVRDKLIFNRNITSTKMICQGYNEDVFMGNLLRANEYGVTGDTMELRINRVPISYWLKVR